MSHHKEGHEDENKAERDNDELTGQSHGHVQGGSEGEADLAQSGTTSGGQAGRITDLEDAGKKPGSPLEFDKDKGK